MRASGCVGWRKRSKALPRLAAHASLLLVAACGDACQPTPDPEPTPSELTALVVPSAVDLDFDPSVTAGGRSVTFSLQVLTRESDGTAHEIDAMDPPVTWIAPAGVTITSLAGTGTFNVPESVSMPFDVTANVPGVPNPGRATIRRTAGTPGDIVLGAHRDGAQTAIVLPSGENAGGGCATDLASAFVWRGDLPNIVTPTASPPVGCRDGAMILWSDASPVLFSPVGWQTVLDQVNLFPASVPPAPSASVPRVVLTLKVFIGVTDWVCGDPALDDYPPCSLSLVRAGAMKVAEDHVDYANTVLERNRVGVQLSFTAASVLYVDLSAVDDCSEVPTSGVHGLQRGELGLYMLNQLSGLERGIACKGIDLDGAPGPDDDRKAILISYPDSWINSVLVHELGHALGLQWPRGGHPNSSLVNLKGFGRHNVMAETQLEISKRFHFTLGQVFRMNADSRSMLLTAGLRFGAGVDCGCDPISTSACPALGRNIAPLEISITWGGTCPD